MSLFNSLQARLVVFLAIPVVFLAQRQKHNMWTMITQILTYLVIAYNAECLVSGGCGMWAWISISMTLFYSLLFIFFRNMLNLNPRPPSPPAIIAPIERKID